MKGHLYSNGFTSNYVSCWWAHGEVSSFTSGTSSRDQTQAQHDFQMEDMVRDAAGHEFDWDRDMNEPMNADA